MHLNLFTNIFQGIASWCHKSKPFHISIGKSRVDLLLRVLVWSLPILSISIVPDCPRPGLEQITDHPWHHYRASADTGTRHQMMQVRSNLAHHHHNCLLHCSQDTSAHTSLQKLKRIDSLDYMMSFLYYNY